MPALMTFGSLFAGVGGFDLGLERSGMYCSWQVEKDNQCQKVLSWHWPNVKRFKDVTVENDYAAVDLICGGDPCPCRSRARWITKRTGNPADLAGYFLAVVAGVRPRWVLRENVPASDDKDFAACLEYFGYRMVIIETNSAALTAQNRERDIVVGCPQEKYGKFIASLPIEKSGHRYTETKYQKTVAYPVLTTHSCRWDARDGYIFDGTGIRVADSEERCQLAGFPLGWFRDLSKTSVARMTGNAVVPQVVEIIGRCILQADSLGKERP